MIDNFEIIRARKATFPALVLPVGVLETIAELAEASVLDNIRGRKQADGSPLLRNLQSTIDRKIRQGRPTLSLVDSLHRFVRGLGASWATTIHLKRSTVILQAATLELRNLSVWLQEGVETKRGLRRYVGYIGLNKKARAAMRTVLRKWVRKEFEKARRRR